MRLKRCIPYILIVQICYVRHMRIIAGRFKNQEIKTPKNAATTRPTTDRTKEAIFSHLDATGMLDGACVVDIYAGTGALGFEALSRGAQSVTFVEADATIAALIAQTARGLKGPDVRQVAVRIVRTKAEKYTAKLAENADSAPRVDVVFMDPPYAVPTDAVNAQIRDMTAVLADDGVIMVERSVRTEDISAPDGYEIYLQKDYGETAVFYIQKKQDA